MLRVGKSLGGVASTHQCGSVVDQQRGVIRLKAERRLVILLRLGKVAVVGFMFASQEIGGGGKFGIAALRYVGECIGVDLVVVDDLPATSTAWSNEGAGGVMSGTWAELPEPP